MFGLGEGTIAGEGAPVGGITSYDDWNQFAKAVQTSTNETDHANLSGLGALRMESLEGQLRKVVETDDTFRLFKALKRTPVTSTVHEWSVQDSIGGNPSGAFNSELGDISQQIGNYTRKLVFVKYMMAAAAISHVASVQRGMVELKATENRNALLRLSRAANWACYYGDESIAGSQFNGIYKQLQGFKNGTHIQSLKGTSDVKAIVDAVYTAYAKIMGVGNFGRLTHIHTDLLTQNSIDRHLDPAYRVNIDGNPNSLNVGAPVSGIKTSYGTVKMEQEIWLENSENTQPTQGLYPTQDDAPGIVTIAVAVNAPAVVGSEFDTAAKAGLYYYRVEAIDTRGVTSAVSAAVSATVAQNGSLTLTITPNADQKQTGYAIYRSKRNPAAAPTIDDYRLVTRITANAGAATTTFVDLNAKVPGSTKLFLLNRDPQSIAWVQLLPATQFPLYPTKSAVIPWAVLLYGALQLAIPNHFYVLENFLPAESIWQPY